MPSAQVQFKKEAVSDKSSPRGSGELDSIVHDLRTQIASLQADCKALRKTIQRQDHRMSGLQKRLEATRGIEDDLKKELINAAAAREELHHQNEELYAALYALQDKVMGVREYQAADSPNPYQQLVSRIREIVRRSLPRDATVIVAAKGDDDLLRLYGRRAWHFPQTDDGIYAGHHPASGMAAIAHMEFLRAKGGEYLLLPATMFWWLDYYVEFKRHLETYYQPLVRQDDTCRIFELRRRDAVEDSNWQSILTEAVIRWQNQYGQKPSILDWHTGLGLAARFNDVTIFSPAKKDSILPYIDSSVDIVAIASNEDTSVKEARRVASGAVMQFRQSQRGSLPQPTLEIEWKVDVTSHPETASSIVIPVCNSGRELETCLAALRDTVPRNFNGEILIVDAGPAGSGALQSLAKSDARVKILRSRQAKSVVAACNYAAKAATGRLVVFVNSAVLPLGGWLPPLLQIFSEYPNAGAAGGRHVDPGGRLLEAGGIVFSNGLLSGFGKSDLKADAALYNFVRAVDYCSASFFATQRDLFLELNGFDRAFPSLDYAAADYAFRARDKGRHIYYQPESAVVTILDEHAPGSNSSELDSNQRASRQLFIKRWAHKLREQPVAPASGSPVWQDLAIRQ